MHQVKLFKGVEAEPHPLEDRINEWLRTSGAKVVQITGNIAPQSPKGDDTAGVGSKGFGTSDILVIVLYEPAGEASEAVSDSRPAAGFE